MNDWKTIVRKLLWIPGWLMVLLSIACTTTLIVIFTKGWEQSPIAYVTYPLSAYTLTTVCITFANTFPEYYRKLKQKFYDHPYGYKYMTDVGYRVRCSLYISLGINMLYSVFKLISGIVYSSFWWGAIAVYYMLLSVIRFLLLKYMRNNQDDPTDMLAEYRRYRLCGLLMVALNATLSGVVLHMLVKNETYTYPEVLIIASATYTFYAVTVSIKDMIKYRKYKSPVMSACKTIRFAAALVSLLSLETSMLVTYGESETFRRIMTSITGTCVCVIVLGMSIYMIVRATKAIHRKGVNENGTI